MNEQCPGQWSHAAAASAFMDDEHKGKGIPTRFHYNRPAHDIIDWAHDIEVSSCHRLTQIKPQCQSDKGRVVLF